VVVAVVEDQESDVGGFVVVAVVVVGTGADGGM
jgi:hypothetical protein